MITNNYTKDFSFERRLAINAAEYLIPLFREGHTENVFIAGDLIDYSISFSQTKTLRKALDLAKEFHFGEGSSDELHKYYLRVNEINKKVLFNNGSGPEEPSVSSAIVRLILSATIMETENRLYLWDVMVTVERGIRNDKSNTISMEKWKDIMYKTAKFSSFWMKNGSQVLSQQNI